MKPIFWVKLGPGNVDLFRLNTSVTNLSYKYDLYVTYDNVDVKDMRVGCAENIHFCESVESTPGKADDAFRCLRDVEYDVLIHIDLDAVLVKLDRLLHLAQKHVYNKYVQMGNWAVSHDKSESWVRGPCTVISKSLADNLEIPERTKTGVDKCIARAVRRVGGKFKKKELIIGYGKKRFCAENFQNCHAVVWHPKRGASMEDRVALVRDYVNVDTSQW